MFLSSAFLSHSPQDVWLSKSRTVFLISEHRRYLDRMLMIAREPELVERNAMNSNDMSALDYSSKRTIILRADSMSKTYTCF